MWLVRRQATRKGWVGVSGRFAVKQKQTPGAATPAGAQPAATAIALAAGIGARIGRAADAIGTREAAARAIGVSPAALQRYVREANNPPFDALARLCLLSGFRMEWLATGVGPEQGAAAVAPTRYAPTEAAASLRGRVAESPPGRHPAADLAHAALLRSGAAAPSPDRLALALALVDEATGSGEAHAAAPLAYLIEAVYDLLGDGATASPAHVLRVLRNAMALRP